MRFVAQVRTALGMMLAFSLGAVPCFAGDVAVLKNGFSIKHERREVVGDITRLYVNADGSSFVDVPTAEIDHFEAAPEEASGLRASGSHSASVSQLSHPGTCATDLSTVVNDA